MDTLLPKTTVGFVSATNSIRLTEQWNKTQLGKLMADPVMKPFAGRLAGTNASAVVRRWPIGWASTSTICGEWRPARPP